VVEDHELLDQEKPSMKVVGCEFHPSWQQVAVFDVATGEMAELSLSRGTHQITPSLEIV